MASSSRPPPHRVIHHKKSVNKTVTVNLILARLWMFHFLNTTGSAQVLPVVVAATSPLPPVAALLYLFLMPGRKKYLFLR